MKKQFLISAIAAMVLAGCEVAPTGSADNWAYGEVEDHIRGGKQVTATLISPNEPHYTLRLVKEANDDRHGTISLDYSCDPLRPSGVMTVRVDDDQPFTVECEKGGLGGRVNLDDATVRRIETANNVAVEAGNVNMQYVFDVSGLYLN